MPSWHPVVFVFNLHTHVSDQFIIPCSDVIFCSVSCLDQAIPPCKSLCVSVKTACEGVMTRYGFPWPSILSCNRFPPENNMCIEPQHVMGGVDGLPHKEISVEKLEEHDGEQEKSDPTSTLSVSQETSSVSTWSTPLFSSSSSPPSHVEEGLTETGKSDYHSTPSYLSTLSSDVMDFSRSSSTEASSTTTTSGNKKKRKRKRKKHNNNKHENLLDLPGEPHSRHKHNKHDSISSTSHPHHHHHLSYHHHNHGNETEMRHEKLRPSTPFLESFTTELSTLSSTLHDSEHHVHHHLLSMKEEEQELNERQQENIYSSSTTEASVIQVSSQKPLSVANNLSQETSSSTEETISSGHHDSRGNKFRRRKRKRIHQRIQEPSSSTMTTIESPSLTLNPLEEEWNPLEEMASFPLNPFEMNRLRKKLQSNEFR